MTNRCQTCDHWAADQLEISRGWCSLFSTVSSAAYGCDAWEALGSTAPVVRDFDGATPWDRVRIANEIAVAGSRESLVRQFATKALETVSHIPSQGAEQIARWVRSHIVYSQETPDIEILQGPIHTLRHRIGDCDDLAILFCALTRAVGLRTAVCGVAQNQTPQDFYHAIGATMSGQLYELSDDSQYGGRKNPPIRFQLPRDSFGVAWFADVGHDGFWVTRGRGFTRIA